VLGDDGRRHRVPAVDEPGERVADHLAGERDRGRLHRCHGAVVSEVPCGRHDHVRDRHIRAGEVIGAGHDLEVLGSGLLGDDRVVGRHDHPHRHPGDGAALDRCQGCTHSEGDTVDQAPVLPRHPD